MRTASKWVIAAVFAVGILAPRAPSQNTAGTDITGVYNGSYEGPKGTTQFTLSLTEQGRGRLTGVFTSHLAGDSGAVASTNELAGFYSPPSRRFQLRPNFSRAVPRSDLTLMNLNGTYEPDGGQGAGQLSGMMVLRGSGALKFEATRGAAASGQPASATQHGTTAAPQKQTKEAKEFILDGLYNGTYTGGAGPRTLKLALRTFDHGTLAGIFTLYDPPSSHDRAYSFSLTGKFDPAMGKFTLEPVKWLTPAPGYFMVGIAGTFDAQAGKVAGKLTSGRHGPFEATRDATESADIARLLPAPAGAAAAATELAGQLPAINQPSPTNISGVYTGACAGVSGKVNAKLSLKATEVGAVTGWLTVELPPDVGSTATYKLDGTWHLGVVHVDATPWGAPAPFNYAVQSLTVRNTAGMGAVATHLLGEAGNRVGWEIEVFRDQAQSAQLDGVMAAQSEQARDEVNLAKAAAHAQELAAATAAAAKEQAAMLKTAAPAQLASKDLVRKSQRYWDAFHTDLIREVFDGGFGSGIGDDVQFELLFTHYVEAFSRDCRDALPARHETVSMTQTKVVRDRYGVEHRETLLSWTVECDSRFAPYYRAYAKALQDKSLPIAVAAVAGKTSLGSLSEQVEDIERFFTNEKSRSAAMRQFGENLLRAAEDKLSLQQAGEKIAGAAAETEPNLPPGRYARFVDGCNGFYRDPANEYYRTAQSGAWCQCLAGKYQHVMSREEEYYYANDFGRRFLDKIAQPHSTDPGWNRLHQAVEDCRQ